jgi:alanyl-tRNA synthetase
MTDTRRIYYEDVYQKEFEAEVLQCRESKNGYEILLDQSAFYPEGGGQPCDLGWLDDVEVRDVQERNGELLHLTDRAMLPGTHVHGKINWERRFDLMQQHSGEHIISGLVHEAYGYENVGFHMGSDVLTVDLSGPLDSVQLEEIERVANQKIWENVPVEITYPSKEELEVIPYRSKKALTGKVRIVTFPGIDICACCGTHVTHTGEIGMVKILSSVKFHEGVRIEMICGVRVLQYLNQIDAQNRSVSMRLSAKPKETAQAVERLWEENFRLKGA